MGGYMKKLFVFCILLSLLCGCATQQQKGQASLLKPYYSGDKESSALILEASEDKNLPFLFDASMVHFSNGDFLNSYKLLNESEEAIKNDETEHGLYALSKVAGEILFNREFMNYEPKTSDSILVNMYKGVSLVGMHETDKARVEFNRTLERQRRAVEEFKEEIAEAKEENNKIAAENNKKSDPDSPKLDLFRIQKVAKSSAYESIPDVNQWTSYGDFVNPYATYLSGLFFCVNGEVKSDYSKCHTMLKRVAGMVPSNSYLKQDIKMAEAYTKGNLSVAAKPVVWVLFENGLAPDTEELRLDVPLFLAGQPEGVSIVSFAMPKLKMRDAAMSHLNVISGKKTYYTKEICNFDKVVQAEYKVHLPMTVTKAVASSASKAFMQYLAQESAGKLGGLLSGILTSAMTRADTRTWLSLPKNIQLARFSIPAEKKLLVKSPAGTLLSEVTLPEANQVLVYVRIPTEKSTPYIQTIVLNQ